jgi:hypothetical protein
MGGSYAGYGDDPADMGKIFKVSSAHFSLPEGRLVKLTSPSLYDNQNGPNGHSHTGNVSGDGTSITLTGNSWRKVPFMYYVRPRTVLEVTVTAANSGEVLAIGLDNDNFYANARRNFQLGGRHRDAAMIRLQTQLSGTSAQSYLIPVGEYFTGDVTHLTFVADDDALGAANANFSNIRIYDDADPSARKLAAHWKLDNSPVDASGKNHHLTLEGTAAYTTTSAKGSHALNLDGTASSARTPAHADFNSADAVSAALWFYASGSALSAETLLSIPQRLILGIDRANGSRLYAALHDDSGWRRVDGPTVPTGLWQHAAFTWSAQTGQFRLYHNGIAQGGVKAVQIARPNSPVLLGIHAPSSYAQAFAGRIDEVLLSQGEFSASTVTDLAAGAPDAASITLNSSLISAYASGQDGQNSRPTSATVSSDGKSIRIQGNVWKRHDLSYNVTPDTILEFNVRATNTGEQLSIGLENDNNLNALERRGFQIAGHRVNLNCVQWNRIYSSSQGEITYVIPIGQYHTGAMSHLIFIGEDDAAGATDATFSRIKLYDKAGGTSMYTVSAVADATLQGGIYANKNYGGQPVLVVRDHAMANYDRQAVARFSLVGLPRTPTTATLNLEIASVEGTVSPASPAPLKVYLLTSHDWQENTITWSNRPTLGTLVANVDATHPGQTLSIDVSVQVIAAAAGDQHIAFAIVQEGAAAKSVTFTSRESGRGPTLHLR